VALRAMQVTLRNECSFVCLFVCSDYQTADKGTSDSQTRDFQEDVNVNTYIIRPLYAYSGICFSSTVGKVELDHAPKSTKEHIELCIYIANSAGWVAGKLATLVSIVAHFTTPKSTLQLPVLRRRRSSMKCGPVRRSRVPGRGRQD
jgi:hypothetical protein